MIPWRRVQRRPRRQRRPERGFLRRDAGRRVTRLAVCLLDTANWLLLRWRQLGLAKSKGSNRSDYAFISGPRARSTDPHGAGDVPRHRTPARARAGRTASCARLCTLWPLPLPHTGEDVHAADRPHTPRHRVRTLPLWPLVSFPTQLPLTPLTRTQRAAIRTSHTLGGLPPSGWSGQSTPSHTPSLTSTATACPPPGGT